MKDLKYTVVLLSLVACILQGCTPAAERHCFFSQFLRSDSLQVAEIWAPGDGRMVKQAGHHGPAVENQFMALRLYFDGRGAIDVYSKSGRIDDELGRWKWYPSEQQQLSEGAGCDEYFVGKTFGLGGVRLWDGEKEIRLETTAGRRSLVGRTEGGAYMEQISYGIPFQKDTVDISIRVEVSDTSRWATVTARELNGKPLRFATGINYPPLSQILKGESWAAVWGEHPADVSQNPAPIGAAIRFDPQQFPLVEDSGNTIRIISVPLTEFSTRIMAASVKEDLLNTPERFFASIDD